jgi:hypothetical protein
MMTCRECGDRPQTAAGLCDVCRKDRIRCKMCSRTERRPGLRTSFCSECERMLADYAFDRTPAPPAAVDPTRQERLATIEKRVTAELARLAIKYKKKE